MDATIPGTLPGPSDRTELTLITCNVCGKVTGPPEAFVRDEVRTYRTLEGQLVTMGAVLSIMFSCVACLDRLGEPTMVIYRIGQSDLATFEKTGDTRHEIFSKEGDPYP